MYVNFEFAALLPSPYSRVKKRGNLNTNTYLDSVESFLYYLSSSSFPLALSFLNCIVHFKLDIITKSLKAQI